MEPNRKPWTDIRIPGIARIDRVVAEFDVWTDGMTLPFAKFKVKIVERTDDFLGVVNVAIKNQVTGYPEWIGGNGWSVEEALEDAIRYFLREVEKYAPPRPLTDEDFEWSDEF